VPLLPLLSSLPTSYIALPGGLALAAGTWPATDLIVYVPLVIAEDCTVLRVWWANGNSTTGNVNLGLYDASGSKLWECGSTAQGGGTNRVQFVDITDEAVTAGFYYIALQASSTSTQIVRTQPTVVNATAAGIYQEAAGSFALPSTAGFAAASHAYIPVFGLDLRGAV
jgi:hypothetical protein